MYYSELYQRWFTEAEIEMMDKPEGENQQQNNQSSESAENAKAYKVYMDCYKDIILSKMTAAEFVFNELTAIVNAHVNYYKPKVQPKANESNTTSEKSAETTTQSKK